MSTDRPTRRRVRTLLTIVGTAALVAPLTAYAGDSFSDVPDSNIFHDDIDWMADNGVTAGCGGDRFCPDGVVTREQMSAFMRRLDSQDVFATPDEVAAMLAEQGGPTSGPVDADTLDGIDATGFLRTGDAADFLGATDQAADADLLDGLDSSAFLAAGGTATDSQLLDGLDSTDFLLSSLDGLVPVARFQLDDDTIGGVEWRSPLTGAPTSEYQDPNMRYRVTLPGASWDFSDPTRQITCTAGVRGLTAATNALVGGELVVYVTDADGTDVNAPVDCVIWSVG